MAVLDSDLAAAVTLFETSFGKDVAAANAQLAKKKLAPIVALSRGEWDKRRPGA
jgi:hypothetical protein